MYIASASTIWFAKLVNLIAYVQHEDDSLVRGRPVLAQSGL
jgi:hypothetical protein